MGPNPISATPESPNYGNTEFYDMTTTPQAALLREAAQNALITLDGIADTNPRDTADFETPAEWIAWAKSRARWAADALRAPIAQEIYAERILRKMLHESDQSQATHQCGTCGHIGIEDPVKGCPKCGFDDMRAKLQATQEPVQAGELPEPDGVFYCSEDTGYLTQYRRPPANLTDGDVAMYEADTVRSLLQAALSARKPTGAWQDVSACPDGDVWFSLSCGHVVMGYKHGSIFDWEASIDHDCCGDATATKAMPITPPDSHRIGLEVKP